MATYVLVHGTGSGGWLWDPVSELLRDAGHGVHTPTLVGVGERANEGGPDTDLTTHVEQIVSHVESLSVPRVILAGFSYSGLVVEGTAATIPKRIALLVFIDALLVPKGQSGFDAFPAEEADRFRAAAHDEGDGWKLPPFPLERVGGIGSVESGVDLANVEHTLVERRGFHPIGSYEERVTWDAGVAGRGVAPLRHLHGQAVSHARETDGASARTPCVRMHSRRTADRSFPDAFHAQRTHRHPARLRELGTG